MEGRRKAGEHEHRPGISALVEGPCAVWSPSSCLAPQVTLIRAILPPPKYVRDPQNKPPPLIICLPTAAGDPGPPLKLKRAGDQDGCPRIPILFPGPGTGGLRIPSLGRKCAQKGQALRAGLRGQRRPQAGRGRVSPPRRRRPGDSSSRGSGSKPRGPEKRKEREKELLLAVSTGTRERPRGGRLEELGAVEMGPRNQGAGGGAEPRGGG